MNNIIPDYLVQEALDYAKLSRGFTSNRHDFHEGTLAAKERKMFEGKLGEKIIKQLFIENQIIFQEDKTSYQEADNYDFLVYGKKSGRELKVDVKTRTEDFHSRTLEMVEQIQNKPKDIYISVRLYKDKPYRGEVIGFVLIDDFIKVKRIENHGYLDNYVLFDSELKDISVLLKHLKKNNE